MPCSPTWSLILKKSGQGSTTCATHRIRNNPVTTLDLQRVALHEAGHAVTALALGAAVRDVLVSETGGLVRHRWPMADPKVEVLTLLAGEAAEFLGWGFLDDPASSRQDRVWAEQAAYDAMDGDLESSSALLRSSRAALAEFLFDRDHWNAVEAVALALIRRGRLTGDELDEIVAVPFGDGPMLARGGFSFHRPGERRPQEVCSTPIGTLSTAVASQAAHGDGTTVGGSFVEWTTTLTPSHSEPRQYRRFVSDFAGRPIACKEPVAWTGRTRRRGRDGKVFKVESCEGHREGLEGVRPLISEPLEPRAASRVLTDSCYCRVGSWSKYGGQAPEPASKSISS